MDLVRELKQYHSRGRHLSAPPTATQDVSEELSNRSRWCHQSERVRRRSIDFTTSSTEDGPTDPTNTLRWRRDRSARRPVNLRPRSQLSIAASDRFSSACVDNESLSHRIIQCLRYAITPPSIQLITSLGLAESSDVPPGVAAAINAAHRGEYSTKDMEPDLIPSHLSTSKTERLSACSTCHDKSDEVQCSSPLGQDNEKEAVLLHHGEHSSIDCPLTRSLHGRISSRSWRSQQFDAMLQLLDEPFAEGVADDTSFNNDLRDYVRLASTIPYSSRKEQLPTEIPSGLLSNPDNITPSLSSFSRIRIDSEHEKDTIANSAVAALALREARLRSEIPSDHHERPAYTFDSPTDFNIHSRDPSIPSSSSSEEADLGSPPLKVMKSPCKTALTPEWLQTQRSRYPLSPLDVHPALKTANPSPSRQPFSISSAQMSEQLCDGVHHDAGMLPKLEGSAQLNNSFDTVSYDGAEPTDTRPTPDFQDNVTMRSSEYEQNDAGKDMIVNATRSTSPALSGSAGAKRDKPPKCRPKSIIIHQDDTYERAQSLLFAQRPVAKPSAFRSLGSRTTYGPQNQIQHSSKVNRFFGEDLKELAKADPDTISQEHDRIVRQLVGVNKKRLSGVGDDVKKHLKRLLG